MPDAMLDGLEENLPAELDLDGPSAPPRSNGALVFEEPWESRAFGLAMSLSNEGAFVWEEFRVELIKAVATWETAHPDHEGYRYYERWLEALQAVLANNGVVSAAEADARAHEFLDRPTGHDHRHDHDHDHDHDHAHHQH